MNKQESKKLKNEQKRKTAELQEKRAKALANEHAVKTERAFNNLRKNLSLIHI